MQNALQNSIEIRRIESFAEMDACVELQRTVWQIGDLELIPRRMFVVAKAIGGQIFGAWDGKTLAGYALAIPGVRQGKPYLHSHMLAVLRQYRNRGLGMQLKLVQRQDALERGIELMEWTFDPLQTKNAYFNIEKLGAIMRRYTPNFYGSSASPLHGSLPTDRLHAEWWLKSTRVDSVLAGKGLPEYAINGTIAVTHPPLSENDTLLAPSALTLESHLQIRHQFTTAFSNGLTVLRFQPANGGVSRYVLGMLDRNEPV